MSRTIIAVNGLCDEHTRLARTVVDACLDYRFKRQCMFSYPYSKMHTFRLVHSNQTIGIKTTEWILQ